MKKAKGLFLSYSFVACAMVFGNNLPTVVSSDVTTVKQDSEYNYTIVGSDSDGDSLSWSSNSLPSWLTIENETFSIQTIAGTGFNASGGNGGLATQAYLRNPSSMAIDSDGNIYIVENHNVRKVDTDGIITKFAGSSYSGFSGDNGAAISAQFDNPHGIAVDSDGNVYITDSDNHRIRKVDSNGTITTIAGTGESGSIGDNGLATEAQLNDPKGIAIDSSGNIYVADYNNHKIRKIDKSGVITTVAGTGTMGDSGNNGLAINATLATPIDVAIDSSGEIYIADQNNHKVKKIDSSGVISTIAGTSDSGFSGDNGQASEAQLYAPLGVDIDSNGNIYIADGYNYRIRKIDTNGVITTIAGSGENGYSGDNGASLDATMKVLYDVIEHNSEIYIVDKSNHVVRKLSSTPTLTGTPDYSNVGVHDVDLVLSDGSSEVTHSFQITVENVEDNATIEPISDIKTLHSNGSVVVDVQIDDLDKNDLMVTVDMDNSLLLDYNTSWEEGNLTYTQYSSDLSVTFTPLENQYGTTEITVNVYDIGGGVNYSESFNIETYALADIAPINNIALSNNNSANAIISLSHKEDKDISLSVSSSGATLIYSKSWSGTLSSSDYAQDLVLSIYDMDGELSEVTITATTEDGVVAETFNVTANRVVGLCGSSHNSGNEFSEMPTDNLCTNGTFINLEDGNTTYNWSCNGSYGGGNDYCSADKISETISVDGECGSSHLSTVFEMPTTNLCLEGNASNVVFKDNSSTTYTWSCGGLNGGADSICSAYLYSDSNVTDPEDENITDITIPEDNNSTQVILPGDNDSSDTTDSEDENSTDVTTPVDNNETEVILPEDNNITDVIVPEDDNSSEVDSSDNNISIDLVDTGKEIEVVESTESNESRKKFILEVKDTNSSTVDNREIIVDNPNAVSTVTDSGYEIAAEIQDENKSISTKIELNNNGTSVSSLIFIDKETGEEKRVSLSSYQVDTNTTIASDGTITVITDSVEAKVNSDGSTEHKVMVNGKETKATSKLNNTETSILEDGTVQAKAIIANDSNSEVEISVNSSSDGKSSNTVTMNEVVTSTESEIIGTTTIIDENGSVETVAITDTNSIVKAKVDVDGSSSYSVSSKKSDGELITSKSTSTIPGSTTNIDENGTITTESKVIKDDSNGEQFQVVAVTETKENGKTVTKYKKVNLTTGESGLLGSTVNEQTPFEEGSEVEVTDENGTMYIDITAPISSQMIVE